MTVKELIEELQKLPVTSQNLSVMIGDCFPYSDILDIREGSSYSEPIIVIEAEK